MKRNKLLTLLGSICLILVLAALPFMSACAAPAPTGVIELRYATDETPGHDRYEGITMPFHRDIEERSNHQVRVTAFPSESLVSAEDMYDSIITGFVDLGDMMTYDAPGRFKLTESIGLPGVGAMTPGAATRALWDMYKEIPAVQAEHAEWKLLWLFSLPRGYIFSSKPIRTLDDIKGMKIRATGRPAFEALQLLGGVPLEVSWPDIYTSMERGTIDGFTTTFTGMVPMRFYEVSKYATHFPVGATINVTVMNLDTWNSLPKDAQEVISEVTGDNAIDKVAAFEDQFENKYLQEATTQHGVEVIELEPAELARWIERLSSVPQDWAAKMENSGLPGKEIVEFLKSRLAVYSGK